MHKYALQAQDKLLLEHARAVRPRRHVIAHCECKVGLVQLAVAKLSFEGALPALTCSIAALLHVATVEREQEERSRIKQTRFTVETAIRACPCVSPNCYICTTAPRAAALP
jgi:hypothetical protein